MEFPIKFDTIKSRWFIVYIEGSQVIFEKNVVYFSQKIDFVLANIINTDEMCHYEAFHLVFHCLPKYMFMGYGSAKGFKVVSNFWL